MILGNGVAVELSFGDREIPQRRAGVRMDNNVRLERQRLRERLDPAPNSFDRDLVRAAGEPQLDGETNRIA